MRQTLETRLARGAKAEVSRDLTDVRPCSLFRARAALCSLLRE